MTISEDKRNLIFISPDLGGVSLIDNELPKKNFPLISGVQILIPIYAIVPLNIKALY